MSENLSRGKKSCFSFLIVKIEFFLHFMSTRRGKINSFEISLENMFENEKLRLNKIETEWLSVFLLVRIFKCQKKEMLSFVQYSLGIFLKKKFKILNFLFDLNNYIFHNIKLKIYFLNQKVTIWPEIISLQTKNFKSSSSI